MHVCALVLAFSALFSVRTQADVSVAPALTDEQQVIATESEWVQAEVHRDADVLGWKMNSQTITDRTVLIDGDTAIVFGTANFTFAVDGKDDKVSAGRYTTTYIKRDGHWRALALQMTALKAK
jgi:hypothetical protein